MQDWEYTTNELIHYAESQNELLHYRTKGALNKKVAQYIRDGGKLINGKIVYAKKAARKASDKLVKGIDNNLDRYNYHNSKAYMVKGTSGGMNIEGIGYQPTKYSKTYGYAKTGNNRNAIASATIDGGRLVSTREITNASDADVKSARNEVASMQKDLNTKLKKELKKQKTKDKLKYALKSTKYAVGGAIDRGMSRSMLKNVKVKRGHTQKWK